MIKMRSSSFDYLLDWKLTKIDKKSKIVKRHFSSFYKSIFSMIHLTASKKLFSIIKFKYISDFLPIFYNIINIKSITSNSNSVHE